MLMKCFYSYTKIFRFCNIIILFLLFCYCNTQIKNNTSLVQPITLNESTSLDSLNIELATKAAEISNQKLKTFLEVTECNSIWLNESLELNDKGIELLNLLQHQELQGIKPFSYLSIDSINNMNGITKDTLLTLYFIEIAEKVAYGSKDSLFDIRPFEKRITKVDFIETLAQQTVNHELSKVIESIEPKTKYYHELKEALKNYALRTSLSKEKIEIPRIKKDTTAAFLSTARVLCNFGLIDSIAVDKKQLITALKTFQKEHGLNETGVLNKNTVKSLNKSPYEYYLQGLLSLEKWRKRADWTGEYIASNIPEFTLSYIKNDSTISHHRTVIGKTWSPTPQIKSELEYMDIYPFWNVPSNITNNELIPKAIKDPKYLSRNRYQVFNGKELVSSENIDFSKGGNYKIRQKGGSYSGLGLIKFHFKNNYNVFFHDTPSKKLFNKEIRAYSHGCIRLENPFDLANNIIKDSIANYEGGIETIAKKRKRKKMYLNYKIPIYIHYTLTTTNNNKIIFHSDVYEKEDFTALKTNN